MSKTKPSTDARPRNQSGQFLPQNKAAGKTKLASSERISEHIIQLAVNRAYTDIQRYLNAVRQAEDPWVPQRSELYDVYYALKRDLQYRTLRKLLVTWITSGVIQIRKGDSGEIDKKISRLFKKSWFRHLAEHWVDEHFEGFRLLQFTEVNPATQTIHFDLVEPKHVRPEYGRWTVNPYDLPQAGIDYRNDQQAMQWLLEIGKPRYLGELDPMAPWIIWKKCAAQAWSQFCDRFGLPLVKGKTNVADKRSVDRMTSFMNSMSGATWAVIDHADEIEFEAQSGNDAYEVFDKIIERADAQMAKQIALNIMSMDVGKNGSRAQSETHHKMGEEVKLALRSEMETFITEQVLPFLAVHGFGTEGMEAIYVREINVTQEDNMIDQWLEKTFDIELEHWSEKYGVNIKARRAQPVAPGAPTEPDGDEGTEPDEDDKKPAAGKKPLTKKQQQVKNFAELNLQMHTDIDRIYNSAHTCEH